MEEACELPKRQVYRMDYATNYPLQPVTSRNYASYNWGVVNTMADHSRGVGVYYFPDAVPNQGIPVCKVRVRNMSTTDMEIVIMPQNKLTLQSLFYEQTPNKPLGFLQEFLQPHDAPDKYFQLKNNVFYELFDTKWYSNWNVDRPSNNHLTIDEFDECIREGLDSVSKLELNYSHSINFVHCVTENIYNMYLPSLIPLQKNLHSFSLQPSETTTLIVLIIGTQLCVLFHPEVDEDPMTKEINLFDSAHNDKFSELLVQRNNVTNSGCAIFAENNSLFICTLFAGDFYNPSDLNSLREIADPENKTTENQSRRIDPMDPLLEPCIYDERSESPIIETPDEVGNNDPLEIDDEDEEIEDDADYDDVDEDLESEEDDDNTNVGDGDVEMLSEASSDIAQNFELFVNENGILEAELNDVSIFVQVSNIATPEFVSVAFIPPDAQLLQPNNPEEITNRTGHTQNPIEDPQSEDEHEKLEYWTLHAELNNSDDQI